jgi:hypothetical protein
VRTRWCASLRAHSNGSGRDAARHPIRSPCCSRPRRSDMHTLHRLPDMSAGQACDLQ